MIQLITSLILSRLHLELLDTLVEVIFSNKENRFVSILHAWGFLDCFLNSYVMGHTYWTFNRTVSNDRPIEVILSVSVSCFFRCWCQRILYQRQQLMTYCKRHTTTLLMYGQNFTCTTTLKFFFININILPRIITQN